MRVLLNGSCADKIRYGQGTGVTLSEKGNAESSWCMFCHFYFVEVSNNFRVCVHIIYSYEKSTYPTMGIYIGS